MARNDVYLNINALSPADAVVTGQQDMTAATVPELVLGDTPTFNFYFTDNTNVWPSWAGNAAYTLTWALSDAVAGDFAPAATTGNATPITGGWSVILPLNSYDLVGLLNSKRVGQPYPVQNLWQQLRVTDPSGNEVTRAMFWTPVRYRAISDTQNTESASPTGGRFVTVNNVNTLTTPTAAQFYAANPVPTSALGTAANGELLIGNGTGFTKATLTAGSGVSITNGSGSITITATDGDITLDDGTAAAPSLKFTADTDTGIYRPSDNVVGISAGGVSRATFGATSAINGTTIPGSKTLVVTTDKLSALAATTSAELAGVISDETGSGALVFATSPTLTTPILGTPQSGTLSSCTGLPISTGVSGLGTNVATFLATPSSANLASAVTDETGTGALVFANTPTLVTPNIGAATGTSVNLSGAGTFGGQLKVTNASVPDLWLQNTSGATSAYRNILLRQNSDNTFKFLSISDAGVLTRDNIITGSNDTGAIGIGVAPSAGVNSLTVAGNLTVSGGTSTFGTANGGTYITTPGTAASTGSLFIQGGNASGSTAGGGVVLYGGSHASAPGWVRVGLAGTSKFAVNTSGLGAGTDVFTVDQAGNLTVSGRNRLDYNSTVASHSGLWLNQTSPAVGNYSLLSDGTTLYLNVPTGGTLQFRRNNVNLGIIDGNFLLGTATNSGNGMLQLATHTTSAGGIGFGTDLSLFRTSSTTLQLSTAGNSVFQGTFQLTIQSLNGNLVLASSGITALTLDTSQNATFAGRAAINGTYATVATGNYTLSLGAFSAGTRVNAGLRTDSIGDLDVSAGSGGSLSLNYDTSVPVLCFGNFSIASGKTFKLGNAYVAGAPTATGYVTIQDSAGNTYKVLVGT